LQYNEKASPSVKKEKKKQTPQHLKEKSFAGDSQDKSAVLKSHSR